VSSVVVVIFVVVAMVSSSAFPVVCSLSRSSPLSLAPGAHRSCRPCCCRLMPVISWSWRHLIFRSLSPFLVVVVLVVLVVHCSRCRGFTFLMVGCCSRHPRCQCCRGLHWRRCSRRPGPVRCWCWGVCRRCRLALFLCSVAVVVLSGLGCWWCVSLRHPAVVAAVLPVSRGGGVVSGRWQCWGHFVCLPDLLDVQVAEGTDIENTVYRV
jgi:hypothetical protein